MIYTKHQTTYYSNFWYSSYENLSALDVGGAFFKRQVAMHLTYLRVLSLLFEKIYIPRSHLIMNSFEGQHKDISQEVITSRTFQTLLERKRIIISSYPGIDEKQDNERILNRSKYETQVIFETDKKYLDSIPLTERLEVNSLAEARGNTVSFPHLAKQFSAYDKKMAGYYLDAVDQAKIPGVPFYHEQFIKLAHEKLDDKEFETVWRTTNSVYLTSGVPDDPNIAPYYNEIIEHPDFRYHPHGFDRYLVGPVILLQFLQIYLNDIEFKRLLFGEFDVYCRWVDDEDLQRARKVFAGAYFDLITEVSTVAKNSDYHSQLNAFFWKEVLKSALLNNLGKHQHKLEDIASLIDALGGMSGILSGSAKLLAPFASPAMRRLRSPIISSFMEKVKATLVL